LIIRRNRKSKDFIVDTVESAEIALEHLNKQVCDVIVSDYQMPGINGIGFLQKVRSYSPNLPFILFTGKGREEVVRRDTARL